MRHRDWQALLSADLTGAAHRLLAHLVREQIDLTVATRVEDLLEATGMARRTYERAAAELEAKGLLLRTPFNTRHTILPPVAPAPARRRAPRARARPRP